MLFLYLFLHIYIACHKVSNFHPLLLRTRLQRVRIKVQNKSCKRSNIKMLKAGIHPEGSGWKRLLIKIIDHFL